MANFSRWMIQGVDNPFEVVIFIVFFSAVPAGRTDVKIFIPNIMPAIWAVVPHIANI
jgi:hypothetical protein